MALGVIKDVRKSQPEGFASFASFPSHYMGLSKGDSLELYDGSIRVVDPSGKLDREFAPQGLCRLHARNAPTLAATRRASP